MLSDWRINDKYDKCIPFFRKVIMLRKFKFMVPFCRCMYTFMVLNISLEIQYGVFFTKQTRKYVLRLYIIPKKNLQFYFWEPNNSIYENEKKNVLWSQNPKKSYNFFWKHCKNKHITHSRMIRIQKSANWESR